jgi:CRP-like cAMP-binding protein
MKLHANYSNDKLCRIIQRQIIPKIELGAGPLHQEFIDELTLKCDLNIFYKGQMVEEADDRQSGNLLFINHGIAQTFYWDVRLQKTIVSHIWRKSDIVFDLDRFLNAVPGKEETQMLEDGEVLFLSYNNLRSLLEGHPYLVSFLLNLQVERERQYKSLQHLLRLPVKDKVRSYLDDHPTIVDRINHEYIADHLGISRSRFSKAYTSYKRALNPFH